MDRTTFVQDQLHAASNDASVAVASLGADPRAQWVENHQAEAAIATRLALALVDHTVTLCEHTSAAPTRLVWAPGMATAGCLPEYTTYAEAKDQNTCDLCESDVPTDEGLIMFALGPVTVLAILCQECRDRTDDGSVDAAAVRFQALAVTVDRLTRLWAGAAA